MPSLPLSPPSTPSLSFGPVIGFVAVFGAVAALSGAYVTIVRFKRRRAQRKTRIADSKQTTDAASITLPIKPEALAADDKIAAAASLLVKACVELFLKPEESAPQKPTVKAVRSVLPSHIQKSDLVITARFGVRSTRTLPGPSPLRESITAPGVVLAAARVALAMVPNKAVRAPAKLDLAKVMGGVASRSNLVQLLEYEVPARFGVKRRLAISSASSLRAVTSDVEADPLVVASVPVPTLSLSIAVLVTEHPAHGDPPSASSSIYSISSGFSFDIDASPPSPTPRRVLAAPRHLGSLQRGNLQRTPRVEKLMRSARDEKIAEAHSNPVHGRRRIGKENGAVA
ncbi:hypothetical protein C8R43DRAFT_44589 [Mycena crocata]|nr:hypothetical protein C8R43DRAFT_44589 [Mycena crocata]